MWVNRVVLTHSCSSVVLSVRGCAVTMRSSHIHHRHKTRLKSQDGPFMLFFTLACCEFDFTTFPVLINCSKICFVFDLFDLYVIYVSDYILKFLRTPFLINEDIKKHLSTLVSLPPNQKHLVF